MSTDRIIKVPKKENIDEIDLLRQSEDVAVWKDCPFVVYAFISSKKGTALLTSTETVVFDVSRQELEELLGELIRSRL